MAARSTKGKGKGKKRKTYINVGLEPEHLALLKEQAAAEDRTLNAHAARILRQHVEAADEDDDEATQQVDMVPLLGSGDEYVSWDQPVPGDPQG